MPDLAHSAVLRYLYIASVTNYSQVYPDFNTTLLSEGVRSCLPHLRDCDVDVAVKEYHGIKSYALAEKRYGVLALRLGDCRPSPFRPLTRTEISSLSKILSPQKCLQYLTKMRRRQLWLNMQGRRPRPLWSLLHHPLWSLRHRPLWSLHHARTVRANN